MASSGEQQRPSKAPAETPAAAAAAKKRAESKARAKAALVGASLSKAETQAKASRERSRVPVVKPKAPQEFNPELSSGATRPVTPSADWSGPMIPEIVPAVDH
jgi:hypothetical protein